MDPEKDHDGTLIQSLDVLDFSVIHLSAYERLQRRHGTKSHKMEAVRNATKFIEGFAGGRNSSTALSTGNVAGLNATSLNSSTFRPSIHSQRTIAVMPFLGSEVGAGNSNVGNRLEYLRACYWSLHIYFPRIVAIVKNSKDHFIAM